MMNNQETLTAPPGGPTTDSTTPARRVLVWDPCVRIFHGGLARAVLVAFLTEDEALGLHTWAGYTALALIAARLVWGVIGPRHARWSDFVRGPSVTLAYLRDELAGRARRYLGHNPAGAAMVVALLLGVVATALSGMATLGANELSGPFAPWLGGIGHEQAHWLEEIHETIAYLTLALVPLHLLGVALASLLHRENLVRAMIDGYKRGEQ